MLRQLLMVILALVFAPLSALELAEGSLPPGVIPGRDQPQAVAPPAAYRFRWDAYVTLVVIGEAGAGDQTLRRPAWVVTYDQAGSVVVGYRATAFRDRVGNLHIDARKAIIAGPKSDSWSPDSFAILADGQVAAIDDANRANGGTVIETTTDAKGEAYRTLLSIAMAIVREMS